MAYSLIQELIRTGALVLWHRYDQGTCRDFSGMGNHGTASTGCLWQGGGIAFPANTDEITVPDAPSLDLTAGTVLVTGDFRQPTATAMIASKRVGAASNYSIYQTTTALGMYDGAVARTVLLNISGAKSVGVTFTNGGTPIGYMNGLSIGALSGTINVTPNDHPLEIGNYANSSRFQSPFHNAVIVNRILTATEVSILHSELVPR